MSTGNNLTPQKRPPRDLSATTDPNARPDQPRGLGFFRNSPGVENQELTPSNSEESVAVVEPPPQPTPIRSVPSQPKESALRRGKAKYNMTIYVASGVKKRLKAVQRKAEMTHLQIVLAAISEKYDRLSEIVDESRYYTTQLGPFFDPDPTKVKYVGGGAVQVNFAPTPEHKKTIDELGRQLGFGERERSTWLAPVLNSYLPGKKETKPDC